MNDVLLSIIVPLYKVEMYVEKCLTSILEQDLFAHKVELIVVNDGSPDKSAEIVKSIGDSRIRLIEQENGGPSRARNTGVNNAKGEWIVFLDADDELLPGALKNYNILISSHRSCDFFACPYYSFNGENRQLCFQYQEGKLRFIDLKPL